MQSTTPAMRRRSLLTLAGLGLISPSLLAACAIEESKDSSTPAAAGSGGQVLETLRVHVPTTLAYMAPMTTFGDHGLLAPAIGGVDIQNWEGVDTLKSLLIQDGTDLAATPSYAAANLFNKGVPIRLLAMQVWGMLYVIGPEGSSVQGLESLRGKKVAVPMPHNMPDIIFRYVLTQKGWDTEKDLEIVPYNDGNQTRNALLNGETEYAVLMEHAASATLAMAKQQGTAMERTADLQQGWAEVTGGAARFPMAGLVMPQSLADEHPDVVAAVLNELDVSIADANGLSDDVAQQISDENDVPVPVVKEAVPRLQLELVPAVDAKADLEDFYTRITTVEPDIVGGQLPADDFYMADPR